MGAIQNDWLEAVGGEFHKPYYKELYEFVKEEYNTKTVYPPADDIFNALHLTPLKDVKVLVLGQDPYHNVNQAHGLSFSVLPGQKVPPSLQNIYQELHDDLGCYIPNHGYLENRAKQGVLMLNNPKHLILTAPHPSPYSAASGFFGCRHFSQANEFLKANGAEPVDWQIENI